MVDPLALIVAILATFRLSRAVAEEEGPFGLFTAARGALDPDQQTWLGRGVNCTYCVSFWLALPAALALGLLGYADAWAWPLTWLGCAGGVLLVKKWEAKR